MNGGVRHGKNFGIIRGEILKISRQIEMEIQQNVWDTGKIVLRRKFSDKYVH